MRRALPTAVALLVLLFFASGCTHVVVEDHPPNAPVYSKPGPPPWAPAHGYRAKHHYHYYPACSVYFDLGRKVYFYMSGDRWVMVTSPPGSICLSFDEFVVLDMDSDKPYTWHADVSKRYPPGQLKKMDRADGKGKGKGRDKWD